ncbi:MAG TPA: M4 family metallopeptidase [Haliangium sp.]|nr:M4 family metallopeptidase [Haliangium sp.]
MVTKRSLRFLTLGSALSLAACTTQDPTVGARAEALSATEVERAMAHIDREGHALGLTATDRVTVRAVIVDDDGAEHVRFDRSHRGLRVVGGDFVSHADGKGGFRGFSATMRDSLDRLSVTPALAAERAGVLATAAVPGSVTVEAVELVINAHERAPALAYDVRLSGMLPDQTPTAPHVLVDARTGAVQDVWDEVHTATGTGNTLYSGAVALETNPISGGFEMRDLTRAGGFRTIDMRNRTSGGSIFTDSDNVWGNGTTSNAASAGADAHYGHAVTLDYFLDVHGRNGINGGGNAGYSRAHYGRNYNNAFWTNSCFCMTYGDGDGSLLAPLVALDVAGHELSHGVTSTSANLIYSGESGGLNEGTSDIFGTMVEFHTANPTRPADYLIGEDIYTPATPGDAFRYMHNPELNGKAKGCWYQGVGSLNVHDSSGVANHFFYLLAEGSDGDASAGLPASPSCNGSTVAGIGRASAEQIWYRALTVYMTSSTNYAQARSATLSAATDLFGAASAERAAVAAAWSAVSVN